MNPIHKSRHCAAIFGMVVLAGCVAAGVDETVLPTRINYQCANNKVLQVQRATDARTAAVLIDNKPVITGVEAHPEWEHILYDRPYNREVNKRRITWENWRDILLSPPQV